MGKNQMYARKRPDGKVTLNEIEFIKVVENFYKYS